MLSRERTDACCECCRLKADLAKLRDENEMLRREVNNSRCVIDTLTSDLERERDKGITWK